MYYVSLSDGKKGFSETPIENIELDIVDEYRSLEKISDVENKCDFIN